MHDIEIVSTDLFVGTTARPRQVLRVTLHGLVGEARVTVTGEGISGTVVATDSVVEIGLEVFAAVGETVEVEVEATDATGSHTALGWLTVAEPGWTMYLVSHFHYDPVWWATQAAYAVTWNESDDLAQKFRMGWQQPGFALIDTHLDLARRDRDYKFVLAEVDLLKPYWGAHPSQRAYLQQLVAQGRLELMGGTYNEPNTNLTSSEVTIRNFVYGAGFQREVFGADPSTAWQLDAFGHDPQFPGFAADAGVSSSSWARGPFRPWGPMLTAFLPGPEGWGDPTTMQFPSEFEWIAPSGRGVLTHYMPAHYSAGWVMDEATSRDEAEAALYELFRALKNVAATRNVLLPVGTDYTPPNRWLTDVHRHWNDAYVWPRFVCALPKEFFAAVRAELAVEERTLSAQSRDMNPIFTGKEVSFIDTKQAHRAAETALVDAEKFATFARCYGAAFPHAAFDKAWRHLIYGAHHDAVTGSESDQVYLDLLTNWHEAMDLANGALEASLEFLASLIQGAGDDWAVTVFNPSSWVRTDVVEARVVLPVGEMTDVCVVDDEGDPVPALVEVLARHPDGSLCDVSISFVASTVPCLGYRTWRVTPATSGSITGWQVRDVTGKARIVSTRYVLEVDPDRGGCVSFLEDRRENRQLIADGAVGNALLRSHEYAEHPSFNEGPWHLLPTGATVSSADAPATRVDVETSALGQRIRVEGVLDGVDYVQTLTLWDGVDRVECRSSLHGYAGADQLFRVQWPAGIAGAMPVSEVGNAVIGRGHALIDVDSAEHPWTLDNPAYGFFALSSTTRVVVTDPLGGQTTRAINTAEIVTPPTAHGPASGAGLRRLAVALARSGVTSATSGATGPRYGSLAVDSNLPDVRISVGMADENGFTAEVLALAPDHAAEFVHQLAASGSARVWVPATATLAETWQPSADLRGSRALPVLLVAGDAATDLLALDLEDAVIEVRQSAPSSDGAPDLDDFTVGLINRGTPGFAVDTAGRLHLSLMRSCTGWPSGVWIDPPRRTAPDGSTFQQQHWSHTFDYAVASGAGDWRDTNLVSAAHDFNHRLLARIHAPSGDLLPTTLSFLQVDARGDVVVTAVKPAGNPLANGLEALDGDSVVIRMYEAKGRPAQIRLTAPGGLSDPQRLDLLERPDDDLPPVDLADGLQVGPGETVTLGVRIVSQNERHNRSVLAPLAEPMQPVYARYWLNNTGTAPMGNVPVAVHFEQDHVTPDGDFAVSVTVASSLVDAAAEGTLTFRAPAGWAVEPTTRDFVLGPGEHLQLNASITMPADTGPGCYLVTAEIGHGGQTFQDVLRVLVQGAGPEHVRAELSPAALHVVPGEAGVLTLHLTSDAAADVPAQVQLITSWDVWPAVAGWNTGATIPAYGGTEVKFPVLVPLGSPAGRWWAIVKIAAAGRVQFTPAIDFVVS